MHLVCVKIYILDFNLAQNETQNDPHFSACATFQQDDSTRENKFNHNVNHSPKKKKGVGEG